MKKPALLSVLMVFITLIFNSCNSVSSEKNIVILTSANFADQTGKGVVMVDFWATWCMPCKAMAPVIEEIATQTIGKVKVGKVDIDANGDLANRFGVQAIPTIIIFKDGIRVETFTGVQSKAALVNALSKYAPIQ